MNITSEKIRSLRRQNGLSQDDLATQMGVTRQTISRWEQGAAQPSEDNLVRLSAIFGVAADYFSCEEELAVVEENSNQLSPAEQVQLFFAQRNNRTALIFACITTFIFLLGVVITWIFSKLCFTTSTAPLVVSSTNIDISVFIVCVVLTGLIFLLACYLWTIFALGRKKLQGFYLRNGGKPDDWDFDEEVASVLSSSHRIIGRARQDEPIAMANKTSDKGCEQDKSKTKTK